MILHFSLYILPPKNARKCCEKREENAQERHEKCCWLHHMQVSRPFPILFSIFNSRELTTSRVRHIKCDEQKPSCYNCLKSSRQCDGYSMGGRRMDQDPLKIVHWKPNALAIHRLSVDLAGEQEERRAFHFFRNNSIMALQGYFDSEFWSRLVLQACHTEPTIRHAVIALGSLHETTQNKDSAMLKNGEAYDKFALQQCNKAITNLNQGLAVKGQQSIQVLLMSCVIFVCFETLQGNYESALTHMESGLRMYRNWQAENSNPGPGVSSGRHHTIDKEIVQIFSRLNLQVLMFPDTHLLGRDFYTAHVNPLIDPPPTTFSCVKEARDRLDNCMNYIFQSVLVAYFGRQDMDQGTDGSLEFQHYQALLSQWSVLFGAFMRSCGPALGAEDRQRVELLEIQYKTATILFSTGMSPAETAFDAYNSEFKNIVGLTSSLVGNSRELGVTEKTGHFSLDMGVVPPLYLAATRCRDPLIRRQALSILSATTRQEGVWNSQMLAKIADRLMSIEEEGIGQLMSSEDVPASSRLSVLNATIYSEPRRVLLELCRPKGNGNGELALLDEWVTY